MCVCVCVREREIEREIVKGVGLTHISVALARSFWGGEGRGEGGERWEGLLLAHLLFCINCRWTVVVVVAGPARRLKLKSKFVQ